MNVLDVLKNHGYRLTKARRELLKVVKGYPMTVQEIYSTLRKKKIDIDLASVYRSLELFVEMGVVHIIQLGEDKKRYELIESDNHHHHLVCNTCGSIEDIALDEKILLKEVNSKSDFAIDHHHLEFFWPV
jgi:Fe2+ or Zn2+ uptake regulation protein